MAVKRCVVDIRSEDESNQNYNGISLQLKTWKDNKKMEKIKRNEEKKPDEKNKMKWERYYAMKNNQYERKEEECRNWNSESMITYCYNTKTAFQKNCRYFTISYLLFIYLSIHKF